MVHKIKILNLIKKIKYLILISNIFFFTNFVKAETDLPLQKYLDKNDIENGETQIYLLNRCSAVYAYASGIILKTDAVSSKKFIEISNNLLFKSVELMVIEKEQKLEDAQKKAEEIRENLFNNYTTDGKKNWKENKSYFKGSYIASDMTICSKLTQEK